jgi:hypothetical protein
MLTGENYGKLQKRHANDHTENMLSRFLFLFDFFEYLENILKKKSKFIL